MSERLSAGMRLGPYEIEALIGAGSMGEVFRARDTRLGRRVAIKTLSAAAATDALELVPVGTGESRKISTDGFRYVTARWLPDGERIVVSAADGEHGMLYVHGLGSEPPVPVTPEGVRGIDWALSPDGRLIAAIGPGRGIQLYSMDGNPPRQVPELTGGEVPIGWIGDGLLIRRRGEPGSFGDVFRVDVESGRQEFWKNILPRDRAGLLSLGSFHTQADGRVQAYTLTRALGTLYVADGLS